MKMNTVLFVDDEKAILKAIQRMLMDLPFHALFASSGQEALELLEKHSVQVIISDVRMPGMSGMELLKIVKERYPHIIRIILSGYAQAGDLFTVIKEKEIFQYMTKPWNDTNELVFAICLGLEAYQKNLQTSPK